MNKDFLLIHKMEEIDENFLEEYHNRCSRHTAKRKNIMKYTSIAASFLLITALSLTKIWPILHPTPENNISIATINPEDVISSNVGMCEYAIGFSSMKEMAEYSDLVVYGEIKKIDYNIKEYGHISTCMEVEILESLKGNKKEGTVIKIVADQGIVSVQAYLDSFSSPELRAWFREGYEKYSDDELDDIYIQSLFYGEVMSTVGQKSVFLLSKSSSYDEEKTYCPVIGPDSEYIEVAKNQFVIEAAIGQMIEKPFILNETILANLPLEDDDTYSLEEIKRICGLTN